MMLEKSINIYWFIEQVNDDIFGHWQIFSSSDMWEIANQEMELNLKYFKE